VADETAAWAPASSDPKIAFEEFKLHLREITPGIRAVPVLMALNVLVFAVMVAKGASAFSPTIDDVIPWGADYGPLTLGGQAWRIVTNMFVHFGAIHLLANMAALLSSGPIVERLFGPLPFVALYFAAGITGSLASTAIHPLVVSAGASGAIFGVYGALGALVLRQRGAIPGVVLSRLGRVAGSFIVYNVIYGAAHAGIDNTAHLGGLIGGATAGVLLIRPLIPGRPSNARRPVLIMAGACALGVIAVLALPRPFALDAIVHSFGDDEHRVNISYNALVDKFNANRISYPEAANQLEYSILPQWRRAATAFESQSAAWRRQQLPSPLQEQLLALLERTVVVRDDGWTRMASALRAGNRQAFIEASGTMEAKMKEIMEDIDKLPE
jgi:rhomboid protease GluP